VTLLAAAPAAAQSGWSMIGQREVSAEADRDTIDVPVQEQHRQLMFCTERHLVHLLDADIRYRDGRTQHVRVRSRIAADGCGRTINLNGRNRDVASMDFTYEAASLAGQRALIQLYAR
jgi:hypothetical protein